MMAKCPVCGSMNSHVIAIRDLKNPGSLMYLASSGCRFNSYICLDCGAIYVPDKVLKQMRGEDRDVC